METGQAHYSPESGNLNEFSSNVDSSVEKPRVSPQIILVMGSELSGKSVQAGILSTFHWWGRVKLLGHLRIILKRKLKLERK